MKHHPNSDFVAVDAGKAFDIGENLTGFRLPQQAYRHGTTYVLDRKDGVILIDCVHQSTSEALNGHLSGKPVLAMLLTCSDMLKQAFGPPTLLSHCFRNAPVICHTQGNAPEGVTSLSDAKDLLEELGISYYPVPGCGAGSVVYRTEPERFVFAGNAIIGRPLGSDPDDNSTSHPPISDGDWEDFVEGWAAVPPPVEAVFPFQGELLFGPESLVVAREAATTPDNLVE